MSRCRTLIFSLLATLLYATNGVNSSQYSSNMFLNGRYQDGIKSQPQQFSVNPASNIFLEHAIISRQASPFRGATYLPPQEFLKCSNGQQCVRQNQCQNGYFTQQLQRIQNCEAETDICCTYRAPPTQPTTTQKPYVTCGYDSDCVPQKDCRNGEIYAIDYIKKATSDRCYAPEVCCRMPSTTLTDDGYIFNVPEKKFSIPTNPTVPQRTTQRPYPQPTQGRQPTQQSYQTTQSTYRPQPTQPTYRPQPTQATYRPQPTQPTYRPQPTQPTYRPQPTQSTYRPQQSTQSTYRQSTQTTKLSNEYLPPIPTQQTYRPQPQPQTTQQTYRPQPQPQTTQQTYRPQPQPQTTQQTYRPQPQPQSTQQTYRPQPQPQTTQQTYRPQPQPQSTQQTYRPQPQPQTTQQSYRPQSTQSTYRQPETTKLSNEYLPPSRPTQPPPQQPQRPAPTQYRPTQPPRQPQSTPNNQYLPPDSENEIPPRTKYQPDREPQSSNIKHTRGEAILSPKIDNPNRFNINNINNNNQETLSRHFASCASALLCTEETFCNSIGVKSPTPIVLSPMELAFRVPLTDCIIPDTGAAGKCCRNPDYVDPWPSTNVCAAIRDDTKPKGIRDIDTNFGQIPWQAMILKESTKTLLCGGAIIEDEFVLTAASCVNGLSATDAKVKAGEWELGRTNEPLPFKLLGAKYIEAHPEYNPSTGANDIAIIRLEKRLGLEQHIQPICISDEDPSPTERCVTTGWGKQQLKAHEEGAIMHITETTTAARSACGADATSVCSATKFDACQFDAGSGLACSGKGGVRLKGISTGGDACGEGQTVRFSKPDVLWINSHITAKNKPILLRRF